MNRDQEGGNHLFTGEPQPIPELDITSVHEFRRRILIKLVTRQAEVLLPHRPIQEAREMSDAELLDAVRRNEELMTSLSQLTHDRQIEHQVLEEILDLVDEMEDEALRAKEY